MYKQTGDVRFSSKEAGEQTPQVTILQRYHELLSAIRAFRDAGSGDLSTDTGQDLILAAANFYEAIGTPIQAQISQGGPRLTLDDGVLDNTIRISIFNAWLSTISGFGTRDSDAPLSLAGSPSELDQFNTRILYDNASYNAAPAARALAGVVDAELASTIPPGTVPVPLTPDAQRRAGAAREASEEPLPRDERSVVAEERHDIGLPTEPVIGERVRPPPLIALDPGLARVHAEHVAQQAALDLVPPTLEGQEMLSYLLTHAIGMAETDLTFLRTNPHVQRARRERGELGQLFNVYESVIGGSANEEAPALLRDARAYMEAHGEEGTLDEQEVNVRVARIRAASRALHIFTYDLWPYIMVRQGEAQEEVAAGSTPVSAGEGLISRPAAANIYHALEALGSLQVEDPNLRGSTNHSYSNAFWRLYRAVEDRIPASLDAETEAVITRAARLRADLGSAEARYVDLTTVDAENNENPSYLLYHLRPVPGDGFWTNSRSMASSSRYLLDHSIAVLDQTIADARASRVEGEDNAGLDRMIATAVALRDYALGRRETIPDPAARGGAPRFTRDNALEMMELSERLFDASDGLARVRELDILYLNHDRFSLANGDALARIEQARDQSVDQYVQDFAVGNLSLSQREVSEDHRRSLDPATTGHRRAFNTATAGLEQLSDLFGVLGFPVLAQHEQAAAGSVESEPPAGHMDEPRGHYEVFVGSTWQDEAEVNATRRRNAQTRWVSEPPTRPPALDSAQYAGYRASIVEGQERFLRLVYGTRRPREPPLELEEPLQETPAAPAASTARMGRVFGLRSSREGDHFVISIGDVRLDMADGSRVNLEEYRRLTRNWGVSPPYQVPEFNVMIVERVGNRYFVVNPRYVREWRGPGDLPPESTVDIPRYIGEVVFPQNRRMLEEGGTVYRVRFENGHYIRQEGDDNVLFNVSSNFEILINERFLALRGRSEWPYMSLSRTTEIPVPGGGGRPIPVVEVRAYFDERPERLNRGAGE